MIASHLTNHDIPVEVWLKLFDRHELRMIARDNRIMRGRNKLDTAIHLHRGTCEGPGIGPVRTFRVQLTIGDKI